MIIHKVHNNRFGDSNAFDSESAKLILASDIEFKSAPLRGAALNSPITEWCNKTRRDAELNADSSN